MLQPVIDEASAGPPTPDAVESAHRCTVNGRAYVHIILRRDGMLISVILTNARSAKHSRADSQRAYPRLRHSDS